MTMESIEAALNNRGFVATRPITYTDTPCFTGKLHLDSWTLDLELRFLDGKYNYPVAYLPEWPHNPAMKAAFGFRHINNEGKVCYVDDSRTWWDSAKAPELVVGSLLRIQSLLNENLSGAPSEGAIAQDFDGYWRALKSLYVGLPAHNGAVFQQVCEHNIERQWLIPKDQKHWLSINESKSPFTTWLVIHIREPASKLTLEAWPPTCLTDLNKWFAINNPNLTAQLIKSLRRFIYKKGKKKQEKYSQTVGIALTWPDSDGRDQLGCGFTFEVPELVAQAVAHDRLKSAQRLLIKDKGALTRYSLTRADAHYIQNRNSTATTPSLKNKNVILVGGGTIGSHLAKLLCSHGAGWGSKGCLHIVDPDIVNIENIGRHLLGAESVDLYKAQALADNLKASFPHLCIKPHTKSITKYWKLITNDCIVIDATGSQTASIAIPDYLSEKGLKPLLLHSWVHGHGAATVALLNDRKERRSACFRCLWSIEHNTYKPKYELSKHPEEDAPVFAGCHQSFHPYASTISMIAATQAMQLLTDYLEGAARRTLRFNIIQKDACQNRNDTTPEKAKDCPLCNR